MYSNTVCMFAFSTSKVSRIDRVVSRVIIVCGVCMACSVRTI